MSKRRSTHAHPGKILLDQYLYPLGISQNALARAAGVTPHRINEIVLGKRRITADSAIRLAAALGTSGDYWLSLQADYDIDEAQRSIGRQISRIERLTA